MEACVSRWSPLPEPCKSLQRAALSRELFHCIQACVQLCCNYANGCEHGKPAIVKLSQSHLLSVLVQASWITEVARLLVWALSPRTELQQSSRDKKSRKAIATRGCGHSTQALWHTLEARKLHIVLNNSSDCCHHCHSAVLDLSSTIVPETSLIPHLCEPSRVPEAKRRHCTQLFGRIEVWGALRLLFLLNGLACACTSTHCPRALHCSCPGCCLGSCCACCCLGSCSTCSSLRSCRASGCLCCGCCSCCSS
mmetsp:Transcript_3782/g.6369  ORF Transcript_3782/g.6369 Transcript_3782/m.6369 type:complete len:252 (-) Transcript_3782:91-846(-)